MGSFGVWQMGRLLSDGDTVRADDSGAAREASSQGRIVANELARLELVCEAMWNLMKEKTSLTDEDLLSEMARLDLMDGKADGKKDKGGPVICGKCDRPNSRRHDFCIYCGEHIRVKPFQ